MWRLRARPDKVLLEAELHPGVKIKGEPQSMIQYGFECVDCDAAYIKPTPQPAPCPKCKGRMRLVETYEYADNLPGFGDFAGVFIPPIVKKVKDDKSTTGS